MFMLNPNMVQSESSSGVISGGGGGGTNSLVTIILGNDEVSKLITMIKLNGANHFA